MQALHYLLHRRVVVPHVVDVEVDIFHIQVFEALIQVVFDVFLPRDSAVNFLLRARSEFRRYDDLIALGKVAERTPQELLAGAVLVDDRGVKEVDSEFNPRLMISRDAASSTVQLCCPVAAFPKPIQPMQIRETVKSDLPNFVYFI